MKKINFNGVNIDVREFLDLIKQKERVSKDMKHASLSIEHHRALMGEEEASQAKIKIGVLLLEGGVVADSWMA